MRIRKTKCDKCNANLSTQYRTGNGDEVVCKKCADRANEIFMKRFHASMKTRTVKIR